MNAIIHAVQTAASNPSTTGHTIEREIFLVAQACWKAAAKGKQLTSASIAAWALIRGADPKRGFSPIANPVKLANGARAWGAYENALRSCTHLSRSALAPWESMLLSSGCLQKGYQWSGEHPLLALLVKTGS